VNNGVWNWLFLIFNRLNQVMKKIILILLILSFAAAIVFISCKKKIPAKIVGKETNHQSPLLGPTRLLLHQSIVFCWMAVPHATHMGQ